MTLQYPANGGYPSFEVSKEELEKYVGKKVMLHSQRTGTIEKAFVSNPCGYWTICFHIKNHDGSSGSIMRGQVREYIDP